MASKASASTALLLSLNLLFFSMVNSQYTCPIDALKLGVCTDILGLVNVVVGSPATLPCCSLINGLVDLEAAVCLCAAIKAEVLDVKVSVRLTLSIILNACGKGLPSGFRCPYY